MTTQPTELATVDSRPLATVPSEPASEVGQLIRLAMEKGLDPTELYAILKEERAQRAKQAYSSAFAAFQRECPPVTEARQIKTSNKGFQYKWADLNDIVDVCRPCLAKHQLSTKCGIENHGGKLMMVCWMIHALGHAEPSAFPYQEDMAGQMVGIQKAGSGMEYAMRYAYRMATGVRLIGVDDDGASTGPAKPAGPTLTEKQRDDMNDALIATNADITLFLRRVGVLKTADIPQVDFEHWMSEIERVGKLRGAK